MLEHSVALKVLTTIGHGILWLGIALGIPHVFEFLLLQVDEHILITPYVKILLTEIKEILVVVVEFLVFLKVLIGIKKSLKKDSK